MDEVSESDSFLNESIEHEQEAVAKPAVLTSAHDRVHTAWESSEQMRLRS